MTKRIPRSARRWAGIVQWVVAAAALVLALNGLLNEAGGAALLGGACSPSIDAEARSALDRLRSELESGDVAAVDAATPVAIAAAKQAARCAPARSETWLILARLEALTAGATPQVSRLLALSCRTAPAQGWTARDRLRMFGPIAGALDGRARACLQNDQRLAVMAEVEEAARAP
mgnify:CR=1 FL=1|jgi:hypothetical protein